MVRSGSGSGVGRSPQIVLGDLRAKVPEFLADCLERACTQQRALELPHALLGVRVAARQLIEAIREEPRPVDMASRLAGELAVGRVLEQAAMARRAAPRSMRLAGCKTLSRTVFRPFTTVAFSVSNASSGSNARLGSRVDADR